MASTYSTPLLLSGTVYAKNSSQTGCDDMIHCEMILEW